MSDPISRLNSALEGRYRVERELGEGGNLSRLSWPAGLTGTVYESGHSS